MRDTTRTWDVSLARRAAAEGLGTFILVAAGTGAVAVDSLNGSVGPGGIAAAFGLAVMIVIFSMGHLSGAHINPAVTLGFLAIRKISARDAAAYVTAQLVGGIGGSLAVRAAFGGDAALGITQPGLVGRPEALLIEFILTVVLMLVIVSVATDRRASGSVAAIAIGGTVALEALVMGAATGASMNPARSLGPALVGGDLSNVWIYIVAPILGAVAGAFTYRWLGTRSSQEGAVRTAS